MAYSITFFYQSQISNNGVDLEGAYSPKKREAVSLFEGGRDSDSVNAPHLILFIICKRLLLAIFLGTGLNKGTRCGYDSMA